MAPTEHPTPDTPTGLTAPPAPPKPAKVAAFDRPIMLGIICAKLEQGIPLTAICREPGMPKPRTVAEWCEKYADASAAIARARRIGYDALADQCLEVADDETHDWELSKKGVISNEVAVSRAKLRVWTRLQLLARWCPEKYAEMTGKSQPTVNVAVGVNVMSEEKLRELADRKRRSIERRRAAEALTNATPRELPDSGQSEPNIEVSVS